MNNSINQTQKPDVRSMVVGALTTIAFVIIIISGIAGIAGSIGNIIESTQNPYMNTGRLVMNSIPSILTTSVGILAYILLTAYCGLSVVLKGKRIKGLYVAGFAILAIIGIIAPFTTIFSFFAGGFFTFASIVVKVLSIGTDFLSFIAFLLAVIAAFVKKPKASRVMGIVAVVLFVIGLIVDFLSVGYMILIGNVFIHAVIEILLDILMMLVQTVAVAGTILFLNPAKK